MSNVINLRRLARGRECQVRIPGVCNSNPETTVLAHIRLGGVGGMGMKPPDICGVHACASCHDLIDGRRSSELTQMARESYILHGLLRTLEVVWRELGE